MDKMTWITINRHTNEIIAQGGFMECFAKADADHFTTALHSKEYWGAWYAPGFWKGAKA